MKKIICIGSVTKDIFFPTEEGIILETPNELESKRKIAFELGAKYQIENIFETLGGCAVNVAVGLIKNGEDAFGYYPIGNDMNATWIREAFLKKGIDSNMIEEQKEAQSDFSFILIDKLSGERTIFTHHGASKEFEVKQDKIKDFEWIFIGDLSGDWKNNLTKIIKTAALDNIKIAFNPRQQMLHQDIATVLVAIASCDILFVNKDEAIEIVDKIETKGDFENEVFLLKALFKIGCKNIILTDGIRGAWGYDGKKCFFVGALEKKALDTTGSGDAFASGFLGAYLKEKPLEEALKWGIVNSSNSVLFYGGQEGLLTQENIEKIIDKVELKKLI